MSGPYDLLQYICLYRICHVSRGRWFMSLLTFGIIILYGVNLTGIYASFIGFMLCCAFLLHIFFPIICIIWLQYSPLVVLLVLCCVALKFCTFCTVVSTAGVPDNKLTWNVKTTISYIQNNRLAHRGPFKRVSRVNWFTK